MAVRRLRASEAPAQRSPAARADPEATAGRILAAGRAEFAEYGFSGARVERIAKAAQVNVQLIYHHYRDKEGLYLRVLEDVYAHIRGLEQGLALGAHAPPAGLRRLVEFTFDYLIAHPDFTAIIRNENIAGGRFVRRSGTVPLLTGSLLNAVGALLARGRASGDFARDVDPVQLCVSILGLCIAHVANRHTLSAMFARDMADPAWLAERRAHVAEVVSAYMTAPRTGD